MYQFKAKKSQIKQYSLCLGNISKHFTLDHMKKVKPKRFLKVFFLDYDSINLIRMGLLGAAHISVRGKAKRSLKSITHIVH